jgi:myo-inositol-1(or 4)-monophosphatase
MIHDKDIASLVEPIIRNAGQIIRSYFHKRLTWQEKENDGGFVTEADLASENYLIQALTSIISGASFFAEESGKKKGSGPYCWVIDPLDGTTNFAHGLPYFCISVALTYEDIPVFGMIYQPLLDELFYATKGKGAYLNGTKIQTSSPPFEKSLIAIGLPYAKHRSYDYLLENAWVIARQAYAIRHFGAVALDIANVAAGRLDAVVFEDLGWWDAAAGIILVTEAGGIATDFQGKNVGPDYRSFIACGSSELQAKLVDLLKAKV